MAFDAQPNNPILIVAFVMTMNIIESAADFAGPAENSSASDFPSQARSSPHFFAIIRVAPIALDMFIRGICADPVLALVGQSPDFAVPVSFPPAKHGEILTRMVSPMPGTPAPRQLSPKSIGVAMSDRFHNVSRFANLSGRVNWPPALI